MKTGTRIGLASLTGIRAVAAAWVVLYHLRGLLDALLPGVRRWVAPLELGYLGVDLFFVLSGFILTINYAHLFRTVSARGVAWFLGLRLARIYPLHLATLGMMLALVAVGRLLGREPEGFATAFQPPGFAWSALLVHGWGFLPEPVWNAPSWSISAEWWAYLWFPLVLLGVVRLPGPGAAVVGWAGAWVGLLVGLWLRNEGWSLDLRYHGGLLRVSGEFLIGVFAAMTVLRGMLVRRADWVALVGLGLAVVLVGGRIFLPLLPVAFSVLIAGLANSRHGVAPILASRGLEYLGRTSFALYMVHHPMIIVLGVVLPPARFAGAGLPVRCAVFIGWFVAMNLASFVLYQVVEEPAREWIRRRLDRWKPSR